MGPIRVDVDRTFKNGTPDLNVAGPRSELSHTHGPLGAFLADPGQADVALGLPSLVTRG